MKKSEYLPYLTTLRRVPDDIVLSVATRDMVLTDDDTCVCGWVLREGLARLRSVDADAVELPDEYPDSYKECARIYGGTEAEWEAVYEGVNNCEQWNEATWSYDYSGPDPRLPLIERAFVERVLEAVA